MVAAGGTTARLARAGSTRYRFRSGLAALIIWIIGFELLPNLHVALHPSLTPHSHEDGPASEAAGEVTIIVTYTLDHFHLVASEHDHADHRHSAAPVAGRSLFSALTPDRPRPPTHGHHSLAHRGQTIAQPPLVLSPPPPADWQQTVALEPLAERVSSRRPLSRRVRGPPVFELC